MTLYLSTLSLDAFASMTLDAYASMEFDQPIVINPYPSVLEFIYTNSQCIYSVSVVGACGESVGEVSVVMARPITDTVSIITIESTDNWSS